MKLYYTNISGEDLPQTRPDLSLGGFRSGTAVPNDDFSNLFGDLSCYSIKENRNEYIAISLQNETGAEAQNVLLHFEYPEGSQKTLEFAFVAFNANNEMEVTTSIYARPLIATFQEANGESNAVNISNLAIGAQIGIWFKRIINTAVISEEFSNANLIENGTPEEANEDIILAIRWGFAILTTDAVTNIAQTTATSGGEITSDSGNAVTARGVCWSIEELPTIADSMTSDGAGIGAFVSSLTGLTAETTYYVRAYATNSQGTNYGDQVSFTTLA